MSRFVGFLVLSSTSASHLHGARNITNNSHHFQIEGSSFGSQSIGGSELKMVASQPVLR